MPRAGKAVLIVHACMDSMTWRFYSYKLQHIELSD